MKLTRRGLFSRVLAAPMAAVGLHATTRAKAVLPKLKPREPRVWPPPVDDDMAAVALADTNKDQWGWFWVGGQSPPVVDGDSR